ncbi:MAG: signal peptidase I [Smithellaceae bacterium]
MSKKKPRSKTQETIEAIIIAILIAAVVRVFLVGNYAIPSESMLPTLLAGDRIIANKVIYGIKIPLLRKTLIPVSKPKRGEIVIFIYPEDRSKDFVKRVIGVAGDKIEIRNKKIWLNDQAYSDAYGIYTDPRIYPAILQHRDNFGPVVVPENAIFVMGDNRDWSLDSRFWGFVDLGDVEGRASFIYWSWNSDEKEGIFKKLRFDRLGTWLN